MGSGIPQKSLMVSGAACLRLSSPVSDKKRTRCGALFFVCLRCHGQVSIYVQLISFSGLEQMEIMQVSSYVISGEPDFLPTTAGLLC